MLVFAQTDPAWEYWDTGTYLAIAIGAAVIAVVATWSIYRYWRKTEAGYDRGSRRSQHS
jgi:H+/Cl- antiporter ClcA